ncbi:hypothetical protein WN943_023023 [Citrus x changshan-huyou]
MSGRRRLPTGDDQRRPVYATGIGVLFLYAYHTNTIPAFLSDIACPSGERLVESSGVPLKPAAEMDLFDLANENEFALPYLNDEVHIEQVTAIKDSLERMLAN